MTRVFYKFRKHQSSEDLARTLRIIAEGQIYAARVSDFNDPNEGRFAMVPDSEQDAKTERVIQTQIRVVSLCRFYSDALLWSYYADAYTGVCLALSFPKDAPKSVKYGGHSDEILQNRAKYGHEGAAERHVLRKLEYWKHEVEYRIIKVAGSEEDQTFVPCVVHGALFGPNTPPEVRAAIEDAGKNVNPEFHSDTVKLNAGFIHSCLGSGLGARPDALNKPWWLNDGAGPPARNPQETECKICGDCEIGDSHTGFFLEEHLLHGCDIQNYYLKEYTIFLCPSCHRKAHLDPNYLAKIGDRITAQNPE